ncbi:DUF547 domain-containing protein [Puniceicoccaceae bacterium K14]|nr:DUF547 domain-containing protein [Puniceicoccaceae bacterium K14]
MIKTIKKLTLLLAAYASTLVSASFDHSLFDAVLSDHVKQGLADYAAIAKDSRIDTYLDSLAAADLDNLGSEQEKLAFYINAYNAYTLKLVALAYPTQSIRLIDGLGKVAKSIDDGKPWKIEFADLGGNVYSLDHIEHEILRKEFNEPRIHFAIVCAAISCPVLRNEAYTADKLEHQLESQGRWFFSKRNFFDPKNKIAQLSKILEWFEADFGGSKEAVLKFAIPYVNRQTATSLETSVQDWTVNYLFYDWKLNTQ